MRVEHERHARHVKGHVVAPKALANGEAEQALPGGLVTDAAALKSGHHTDIATSKSRPSLGLAPGQLPAASWTHYCLLTNPPAHQRIAPTHECGLTRAH